MRIAGGLVGAVLACTPALPLSAHDVAVIPDPGFVLPLPGSYSLPPIQRTPGGEVIDRAGRARDLAEFTTGRITLLGLVYTRCDDPEGCPRATWAFSSVRAMLRPDPALEKRVRLVTLSFDPVHDDYRSLGKYADRMGRARPGAEWQFLTTRSRASLAPILDGLGQDLRVAADSDDRPGTEAFTHSLKVFLVDADGVVREIYSTGYLVPQVIVNDIRTLAAERQPSHARR